MKAMIIVVGCLSSAAIYAGERLPSLLISHSWKISEVSKNTLAVLKIKRLVLNFHYDGTWDYNGTRVENNIETKTHGAGTWSIDNDKLTYSIDHHEGSSVIAIEKGVLRFSPDPVLSLPGGSASNTEYYNSEASLD